MPLFKKYTRDPESLTKERRSFLPPAVNGFLLLVARKLGLQRGFRRSVSSGLVLVLVVLLLMIVTGTTYRSRRTRQWLREKMFVTNDDDLDIPPRYLDLKEWQRNLPQHNLSLPYPEGATGRYVKFTSQINMLGWNNVLNELIMLTYLAYRSERAYVFQDYIWKMEYYPWSRKESWEYHAHTPLPALISGPTAGGPWGPGDKAPRSIHEDHWSVVCPKDKVKVIWTHEIKRKYDLHWTPTSRVIFDTWNKILLDEPAQCVEVIAPERDVEDFGQVFDLWLWGSDRILPIWEELRDSPVSQLWGTSPLIQGAVDKNEHLFHNAQTTSKNPWDHVFAVHVRRGDYEGACLSLANWKSTFYSWNQLPYLPDRFTPAPGGEPGNNTAENVKAYFDRCLPDMETIIDRIDRGRDDWEKEVYGEVKKGNRYINTVYILTNDKSSWLDELKRKLAARGGWNVVTSNDIKFHNAQEKDVGMAIDMELARKSAIFLGNGWSSFTSNILHRRLVDKKIPISNRFF